ncbi:unnamed protein product [Caenorhabditis bovis]|uniref:CX domain-containing protein n=1 Tax=Caenorhabditis bovis TaxID=2654633 RepID=A0A8S1EJY5_9PELO|nr:unnamed protein product [Caenorhabditis bovis]
MASFFNSVPDFRSLNNGYATDGDPAINDEVYRIFMLKILDGFNVFKIKMYNDRSFIYLTRRDYWLGHRYYYMDNYYYLPTRDTCAYRMNETQREKLFYEEDNEPIYDIIYQCQRYQEYCCGLNCCKNDQIGRVNVPGKLPKYPWQDPWNHNSVSTFTLINMAVFSCCFTFGVCIAIYDINTYGSGLYLALVSIVTVVVVVAFCLVGTEDQTEPTVAKKVWSTTRQTMRRFKKEPSTRMPAGVEIRIVNIDLEAEGARSCSITSTDEQNSHLHDESI